MTLLLQVITSRDVESLALAAALFVCLAAVAFVLRRRLRGLLTDREWRVFFKLVAIIVMALLLVFTSIAVEFPAERFIYGRF
jgi:peptidoglycan biosynthesis protein MviN/MurJ (putative lipid II flippase)